MCKAGIADYEAFAKDILSQIPDRSISFGKFRRWLGQPQHCAWKVRGTTLVGAAGSQTPTARRSAYISLTWAIGPDFSLRAPAF
jgi:hypothetical protein